MPRTISDQLDEVVELLRGAGARFAYLFGSQSDGSSRTESDIDIAAFFGRRIASFDVLLPSDVDLLVLDTAPLELAGRVALHGTPLFNADFSERVHWEATTRKIYLDEKPRFERAHREFIEAVRHG
ncbi:nucleotidyltransferase domain-containing protein [Paramicrobacterium agarici]|uniref:Polymerase beta nucleotidyltransferase domain-containing protein n=1 Tax=Paramicrobacterium agarici TaxID=630514 RepID=A0A2A9DS82_9MICO|nr:nucleotidyltransferase domain-containing protein [Microbacterium agarici]PFG29443.1 hypothetical protein ATJ78_0348 [Microbacterium agarici]